MDRPRPTSNPNNPHSQKPPLLPPNPPPPPKIINGIRTTNLTFNSHPKPYPKPQPLIITKPHPAPHPKEKNFSTIHKAYNDYSTGVRYLKFDLETYLTNLASSNKSNPYNTSSIRY